MADKLTPNEIEAYVAEYTLLADKSKNIRTFLNQKGLTDKEAPYNRYTELPPKAQQLFHILFEIKFKELK